MQSKSVQLKSIRKKTGLTQKAFAEKFNINSDTYRHWESGFRTPSDYVVSMIRTILVKEREYQEILNAINELENLHCWTLNLENSLPNGDINPVTLDYYQYPCVYKNEDVVDVRYYKFGDGKWWNYGEDVSQYVVAWFDIYKHFEILSKNL